MKKTMLAFVLAIALTVAGFNLSYAKVNSNKTSAKAKTEKVANVKKSSTSKKHKKHAKSAKKSVKKNAKKAEKKS